MIGKQIQQLLEHSMSTTAISSPMQQQLKLSSPRISVKKQRCPSLQRSQPHSPSLSISLPAQSLTQSLTTSSFRHFSKQKQRFFSDEGKNIHNHRQPSTVTSNQTPPPPQPPPLFPTEKHKSKSVLKGSVVSSSFHRLKAEYILTSEEISHFKIPSTTTTNARLLKNVSSHLSEITKSNALKQPITQSMQQINVQSCDNKPLTQRDRTPAFSRLSTSLPRSILKEMEDAPLPAHQYGFYARLKNTATSSFLLPTLLISEENKGSGAAGGSSSQTKLSLSRSQLGSSIEVQSVEQILRQAQMRQSSNSGSGFNSSKFRGHDTRENFYLQMNTSPNSSRSAKLELSKDVQHPNYQKPQLSSRLDVTVKQNESSQIVFEDGSLMAGEKLKVRMENTQKQLQITSHNSQNLSFVKLDTRSDAKLVSEWVDASLAKVFEAKAATTSQCFDLFSQFQHVFEAAIGEIVRQVSLECQERAQVLKRVWKLFTDIVEEFLFASQKTNIRIEADNFKRTNIVHKQYLGDIDKISAENTALKELNLVKEATNSRLKAENRYLRKKWKHAEQRHEFLRQDIEQVLQQREEFQRENQLLKMKMESILLTQSASMQHSPEWDEPSVRFHEEVEKVRVKLHLQFALLFEEQKALLQETYHVRQELKEKELYLSSKNQKEDEEASQILGKGKQIVDLFDDVMLDDKCVDTRDLITSRSIGVDAPMNLTTHLSVQTQTASDLLSNFAQTNVVQIVNMEVQTTTTTAVSTINRKSEPSELDEGRLVSQDNEIKTMMLNQRFREYLELNGGSMGRQDDSFSRFVAKLDDVFSGIVENEGQLLGDSLSKISQLIQQFFQIQMNSYVKAEKENSRIYSILKKLKVEAKVRQTQLAISQLRLSQRGGTTTKVTRQSSLALSKKSSGDNKLSSVTYRQSYARNDSVIGIVRSPQSRAQAMSPQPLQMIPSWEQTTTTTATASTIKQMKGRRDTAAALIASKIEGFQQTEQTVINESESGVDVARKQDEEHESRDVEEEEGGGRGVARLLRVSGVIKEENAAASSMRSLQRIVKSATGSRQLKEATQVVIKVLMQLKKQQQKQTNILVSEHRVNQQAKLGGEQRVNQLVKQLNNIMIELSKFLHKNPSMPCPYFHAFVYDNLIQNFGYCIQTEERLERLVRGVYDCRSSHSRLEFYFQLISGEINHRSFKQLMEHAHWLEDESSSVWEKSHVSVSRVQEYLVSVVGSSRSKQYEMREQFQLTTRGATITTEEAVNFVLWVNSQEVMKEYAREFGEIFNVLDVHRAGFVSRVAFQLAIQLVHSRSIDSLVAGHDLRVQPQIEVEIFSEKDSADGFSLRRFAEICQEMDVLGDNAQRLFLGEIVEEMIRSKAKDVELEKIERTLLSSSSYGVLQFTMIEDIKAYFRQTQSKSAALSSSPLKREYLRLKTEREVQLVYRLLETSAREAERLAFVEELFLPIEFVNFTRKFQEISY